MDREKKVINQITIDMKKNALIIFVILIGLTSFKNDVSDSKFTYDEQELNSIFLK
jgi:hypothetical protein